MLERCGWEEGEIAVGSSRIVVEFPSSGGVVTSLRPPIVDVGDACRNLGLAVDAGPEPAGEDEDKPLAMTASRPPSF